MSQLVRSTPKALVASTVLLLTFVSLAGCIGGSSAGADTDVDTDDVVGNETANITEGNASSSGVVWEKGAPVDPNSSLHTHDYWQGRSTYTIVDEMTVPGFSSYYKGDCVRGPCATGWRQVNIPIEADRAEDEQPKYIYPGTGQIDVTLSWSGGGMHGVDPVMCAQNKRAAGGSLLSQCAWFEQTGSNSGGLNGTHHFSASGETMVIEGEQHLSRPIHWDVPHTFKSNWRFAIIAQECYPAETGVNRCPPEDIDSFTVTIKIHRADVNLPLNPPHFDYYEGADEVTVLPKTTLPAPGQCESGDESTGTNTHTTRSWYNEVLTGREYEVCEFRGGFIKDFYNNDQSDAPVIPPGTDQVVVDLEWSSDTDVQLRLRYRDSLTNWGESWVIPDAAETDCSGTSCTYTFAIGDDEADSLYAIQTVWEFAVFYDHTGEPQHEGSRVAPVLPGQNLEVSTSIKAVKT